VAARPLCRRPGNHLIRLLKLPACVGEARRIVLVPHGDRCRRTFAGAWEFVRFAEEQTRGRRFTSPPQRPEPRAPAGCPLGRFRHRGEETIGDGPGE
jgi:hypothetical protein